jgi:hypothetical protein
MAGQELYPSSPELRRIAKRRQYRLALLLLAILAFTFVDVRAVGGITAFVVILVAAAGVLVSAIMLSAVSRELKRHGPSNVSFVQRAAVWKDDLLNLGLASTQGRVARRTLGSLSSDAIGVLTISSDGVSWEPGRAARLSGFRALHVSPSQIDSAEMALTAVPIARPVLLQLNLHGGPRLRAQIGRRASLRLALQRLGINGVVPRGGG